MAAQRASHKEEQRRARKSREENLRLRASQNVDEDTFSMQPHPDWPSSWVECAQSTIPWLASFLLYFSPQGYLKATMWLLLWGFFSEIGFGLVYFVVGLIVILLSNLSWTQRERGELSPYSVFNPNFEVLRGTLTAEQVDQQLRRGGF